MAATTLNVRVQEQRMKTLEDAAFYIGVPTKRFPVAAIASVEYPTGEKRYDKHDLDRWIDGLKVGGFDSDDDVLGKLA